jgi:hypothetical protein
MPASWQDVLRFANGETDRSESHHYVDLPENISNATGHTLNPMHAIPSRRVAGTRKLSMNGGTSTRSWRLSDARFFETSFLELSTIQSKPLIGSSLLAPIFLAISGCCPVSSVNAAAQRSKVIYLLQNLSRSTFLFRFFCLMRNAGSGRICADAHFKAARNSSWYTSLRLDGRNRDTVPENIC